MFPYEAYKAAVVDESNVRGAGVEAMLINVERDGETGRLQLGIEPLGRYAEVDLEGGTVTQDGEADVVIFDLVEPGSWFVNRPDAAHLWCVACSRAKEKLIVVGEEKGVRHGNYSGPMFADVRVKGLGEVSAESLVVGGNKAA